MTTLKKNPVRSAKILHNKTKMSYVCFFMPIWCSSNLISCHRNLPGISTLQHSGWLSSCFFRLKLDVTLANVWSHLYVCHNGEYKRKHLQGEGEREVLNLFCVHMNYFQSQFSFPSAFSFLHFHFQNLADEDWSVKVQQGISRWWEG